MNNADMPAMPVFDPSVPACEIDWVNGLSKREEAILRAMQGLCVNTGRNGFNTPEEIADQAEKIADATLAVMERTGDQP